MMKWTIAMLFTAGSLFAAPAFAQPHRQGPPPEALEACEELKSGDACRFVSPRGERQGTCFTPREDKPLACRPAGKGPRGEGGRRRHGPPPEALEACQGLKDGDACGFETPRGERQGTCFSPREDKPLACRPEGGPEHGSRGHRGPPQDEQGGAEL